MKRCNILLTLFLLYVFIFQLNAQDWLNISISPTFNGMGEVGCSLPSSDIFSYVFNPANGLYDMEGLSIGFNSMNSLEIENVHLRNNFISFSFNNPGKSRTLSLNVGKNVFDFDEVQLRQYYKDNESGYETDSFNDYSLHSNTINASYLTAIKKNYLHLLLSISVTGKFVDESLKNYRTIKSKLMDLGLIVTLPFGFSSEQSYFKYDFWISFGYSLCNIGLDRKSLSPSYSLEKVPYPLIGRLGTSFTFDILTRDNWKIFELKGAREGKDSFVEFFGNDGEDNYEYQLVFGDIDFLRNVIRSKPDYLVTVMRGYEIGFFETFYFRAGRRIDLYNGYDINETGYGINSKGIFYLMNILTGYGLFKKVAENIELRYNESWWANVGNSESMEYDGIRFKSYTLNLKNLNRIGFKNTGLKKYAEGKVVNNDLRLFVGLNRYLHRFGEYMFRLSELIYFYKQNAKYISSFSLGIEKTVNFLNLGLAFHNSGFILEHDPDELKVSIFMPEVEFYTLLRINLFENYYLSAGAGCFKELVLWIKGKRVGEKKKYCLLQDYEFWGSSFIFGLNYELNDKCTIRLSWRESKRRLHQLESLKGKGGVSIILLMKF